MLAVGAMVFTGTTKYTLVAKTKYSKIIVNIHTECGLYSHTSNTTLLNTINGCMRTVTASYLPPKLCQVMFVSSCDLHCCMKTYYYSTV